MTEDFPIVIRKAEESELELLEREFSPGDVSRYHFQRFEEQQKGKGIYLIAWHEDVPVGHLLVEWGGPQDQTVATQIDVRGRAYLFAVETRGEYRRRGVATKMVQEGEKLAREHGCEWTGLEVGRVSNPEARKLYEKLGYKDWGLGELIVSCSYLRGDGQRYTEFEVAIYMDKKLF